MSIHKLIPVLTMAFLICPVVYARNHKAPKVLGTAHIISMNDVPQSSLPDQKDMAFWDRGTQFTDYKLSMDGKIYVLRSNTSHAPEIGKEYQVVDTTGKSWLKGKMILLIPDQKKPDKLNQVTFDVVGVSEAPK